MSSQQIEVSEQSFQSCSFVVLRRICMRRCSAYMGISASPEDIPFLFRKFIQNLVCRIGLCGCIYQPNAMFMKILRRAQALFCKIGPNQKLVDAVANMSQRQKAQIPNLFCIHLRI